MTLWTRVLKWIQFMLNRVIKYYWCFFLFGCGGNDENFAALNKKLSHYTLDSLKREHPIYKESASSDSSVFYLQNFKGEQKYEVFAFDSTGRYLAYLKSLNDSVDIYTASYDQSLNIVEEHGDLFHLKVVDCFEKDTPNLFILRPVTPPFFNMNFRLFYKDSLTNSYTKIVDKTLKDDKDVLFGKRSFLSGGEFLGIVTMTRDNYERRDTFELQFFDCDSNKRTRPQ